MIAPLSLSFSPSMARRTGTTQVMSQHAFTLVEILIVMIIALLIMGMVMPAFRAITGGRNLELSASEITGVLDQARAYAMANNTYVFVGLVEVGANQSQQAIPQTEGVGRVVISAVASRDGMSGYDHNDPSNTWAQTYAKGTRLIALNKIQRFENLHIATLKSSTNGGVARPVVNDAGQLGNVQLPSQTPFEWPLGKDLGAGQYRFNKVIEFDSRGVVRIAGETLGTRLEIGLQRVHGSVAPVDPKAEDQAAIQIDSITGETHIYRP